jgi:hypothetical protein
MKSTLTDPYRVAHDRTRVARGKASEHTCIDCDKPAEEWSLRSDAIADLQVSNHDGQARWWSPLVDDYAPRCTTCHRRHDTRLRMDEDRQIESVLHPEPYADDPYFLAR